MAIKPILFNTEMVRSILDGRKTCTRRKIPIDIVNNCDVETDGTLLAYENCYGDFIDPVRLCRYQPGDILYVRETVWQKIGYYLDVDGETKPSWYNEFRYVATDEKPETGWNYSWAKRPSIHMPKEAARIWLRVTNVRIEQLQEITADGIRNEGLSSAVVHCGDMEIALKEWEKLWNSTIKKSDIDRYGWDANPYVWVISFERCEKPAESPYAWNDAIHKLMKGV